MNELHFVLQMSDEDLKEKIEIVTGRNDKIHIKDWTWKIDMKDAYLWIDAIRQNGAMCKVRVCYESEKKWMLFKPDNVKEIKQLPEIEDELEEELTEPGMIKRVNRVDSNEMRLN